MKNAGGGRAAAKGLNYVERAIDSVFNAFADGVGRVVYDSALKTPQATRSEIVYGGVDKDVISGHSFPSIESNIDGKFSGMLERRSEKIISKLDEALKAGYINGEQYNQTLFSEMKNLQYEFAKRKRVYKQNFLPFAVRDILGSEPAEKEPEIRKRVPQYLQAHAETSVPSGFATAMLGPSSSILLAETPSRIIKRKAISAGEPGGLEKDFYKLTEFAAGGLNYVGKAFDKTVVRPLDDALYWIGHQMAEHPIAVGVATVTGMIGLGAAADSKYNNGNIAKSAAESAKNTAKGISAGAAGFIGGLGELMKGNQPPVIDSLVANNTQPHAGDTVRFDASASDPDGDPIARYEWQIAGGGKVETAVTPTPSLEKVLEKGSYSVKAKAFDGRGASGAAQMNVDVGEKVKQPSDYDYYDSDFKVGIMIEGGNQSKANVTNMFKIIKARAPDRYAADAPYFPKKIIIHDKNYNYYAIADPPTKYLPGHDDEIGLARITDVRGGSENENLRLDASLYLLEELDNARNVKTGIIYGSNVKAELAVNIRLANDKVNFSLWTREQADAYIKQISEELNSGEYHKKYS